MGMEAIKERLANRLELLSLHSPHSRPREKDNSLKSKWELKLVSPTYLKSLCVIRGLLFQETERRGQKIHVAKETCWSWHSYINFHFYWRWKRKDIFPKFICIPWLPKKGILPIYFIFSCKQLILKELKDLSVDLLLPARPLYYESINKETFQ